jgi:hypothetical protein
MHIFTRCNKVVTWSRSTHSSSFFCSTYNYIALKDYACLDKKHQPFEYFKSGQIIKTIPNLTNIYSVTNVLKRVLAHVTAQLV